MAGQWHRCSQPYFDLCFLKKTDALKCVFEVSVVHKGLNHNDLVSFPSLSSMCFLIFSNWLFKLQSVHIMPHLKIQHMDCVACVILWDINAYLWVSANHVGKGIS